MIVALFSCLGSVVYADSSDEATVTVDGVTTTYATLEEALTQAYNKTVTITLLKDVTIESPISLFTHEDILLNGDYHTITGSIDGNIIYVQDAKLVLDNVRISNLSDSTEDVIYLWENSELSLQNNVFITSQNGCAVYSNGNLKITDGEFHSYSDNDPDIRSYNGSLTIEANDGNEVNVYSESMTSIQLSGDCKFILSGNVNVQTVKVDFSNDNYPEIFLSGALTGRTILVDHFNNTQTNDYVLGTPANGYTITESDAETLVESSAGFETRLNSDGNIWAYYKHYHTPESNISSLENGQHVYSCACGEQVYETCNYSENFNDELHWAVCTDCGYEKDHESHEFENCECTNCDYLKHKVDEWTVYTDDLNKHCGTCTVCKKEVTENHKLIWRYDDTDHWTGCNDDCGYKSSVNPHNISEKWLPGFGGKHYKNCGCGYIISERHKDTDSDGYCNSCSIVVCFSHDGDHYCDDCYWIIEELCTDADADHVCDFDVCRVEMEWLCTDNNSDHNCDFANCGKYMHELCTDKNEDYSCDVCGKNPCKHSILDYTINGNGTHSGKCVYCEKDITEECDFSYGCGRTDTGHWSYCRCSQELDPVPHVSGDLVSTSFVGHWFECGECGYDLWHRHTFANGVCTFCNVKELPKVYDIYVGGVGLEDGQYIDINGKVTTSKPSGGYAYYKDGVLELYDYSYDGEGLQWKNEDDTTYSGAVYATKDMTVMLLGDSFISCAPSDGNGDGIVAEHDLTICGDGSLRVLATDDAIQLELGDFTLESGEVSLGYFDYDEDGNLINEAIKDDGIDIKDGDCIIEDGTLIINADDCGIYIDGMLTVRDGYVDITADDVGVSTGFDVIITGGDVIIESSDFGIESYNQVVIAGGYVDIYSDDYDGLYAYDSFIIYGGEVYVDAYDYGIYTDNVTVYGGILEVYSGEDQISCDRLNIYVEIPDDVTYNEELNYIYGENGLCLEGDDECVDKYPTDHKCDACGEDMGGSHEAGKDGHSCDYCGGPVTPCTPGEPVCEDLIPATCEKEGSFTEIVYCTLCEFEISR